MIIDLWLVYSFIRRLATPFNEWEAFKLGIIDEKGNILKKRKDLTTIKERSAFGVFDVMILNLKKLLAKIPGGSTRIASYAAALYLIREWNHFSDSSLLVEEISDEEITESVNLIFNGYSDYITLIETVNKKMHTNALFEQKILETPTVNVGSGAIAGVGIGPDGEPGFTSAQMRRYKKKNKTGKRLRDIIGEDLYTAQHGKQKRYKKQMRPSVPAAVPSERIV